MKNNEGLIEDSVVVGAKKAKEAMRNLKNRRRRGFEKNPLHWQDDMTGVNDNTELSVQVSEAANDDVSLDEILEDPTIDVEIKLIAQRIKGALSMSNDIFKGLEEDTEEMIEESLKMTGADKDFSGDRFEPMVCQFTSWEDEI